MSFIEFKILFYFSYYFNRLVTDKKMVKICYDLSGSTFDFVFKCLSNLLNMFVYRLTLKLPIRLSLNDIRESHLLDRPKLASSYCLNDLFELAFGLDKDKAQFVRHFSIFSNYSIESEL